MDYIKPVGEKSIFGAIIFFLVGLPLFLISMIFVLFAIFSSKGKGFDVGALEVGGLFAVFAIGGLLCMQRAKCYYRGTAQVLPDVNPIVLRAMQISYGTMALLNYLEPYFTEYSSIIGILQGLLFISPIFVWAWLRINPVRVNNQD